MDSRQAAADYQPAIRPTQTSSIKAVAILFGDDLAHPVMLLSEPRLQDSLVSHGREFALLFLTLIVADEGYLLLKPLLILLAPGVRKQSLRFTTHHSC